MAFDVDKLFAFAMKEIAAFAEQHGGETFYGFAIDASYLSLNSEQQFEHTLAEYQARWERENRSLASWDELTEKEIWASEVLLSLEAETGHLDRSDKGACLKVINEFRAKKRAEGNKYKSPKGIASVRANTGDWAYQGFADMTSDVGFDERAYEDHYHSSPGEQEASPYAVAMDLLLKRLVEAKAFECLKRSRDFNAARVEHDY